ncbi:N-acetylglucosamine-6-phosphate deacetylase [Pseudobacillus sp. FSL P4-0506]|uniref:N-acetylglucosamine-6-phosphate deacetylase n=1 Tax=unclassified Pseudobacillus TaxID=2619284 RepID=UPI0030F5E1D8
MSDYILTGATIFAENETISDGFIRVTNGKIASFGRCNDGEQSPEMPVIQLPKDSLIIPGAVDIHIHGAGGADAMDATEQCLQTISSELPKEGTTSFLATTMTQSQDAIQKAIQNAGTFRPDRPGYSEMVGIHLEGPFISKKHPGAQPKEAIMLPDASLFDQWQQMANGRIRLVTMAPEEPGAISFVQSLVHSGITVSAGHTDATYEQLLEAECAGVKHVTHLYNGMRGMHHREPGTAGGALLIDSLFIEMIVDGIHIHPEMVRLAFRQKTADKTVLITDAMRAKGLKDGQYELGGQPVAVEGGKATLADGTLAGSTLTMNQAIKNMMSYTGCSIRDIIKMTAENPARQIGIFDRKGSIALGKDADLVVYNKDLDIQWTICRGETAFLQEDFL